MQQNSVPIEKDLVLIGGGHAHVSVIKYFGMNPIPGVRVTVISRDLLAPYSGMLPGYVAGHYSLEQCHIDLGPLCQFANARLIHDEVIGLDPDTKKVYCRNRPAIDFDVLSINIGSSPDTSSLKNKNNVVPVKPISHFVERWHQLRERLLNQNGNIDIAIVGGGAGGVELCLAMQYRLNKEIKQSKKTNLHLQFHLFDSNSEILTAHNKKIRSAMGKILTKRSVMLHLDERVTEVSEGSLKTEAGISQTFSEILWVTKASAQTWLQSSSLVLNPEGFVSVDPSLQSVSHPSVFAAGDIADVMAHPRPKAGVFAVRQGLPLAKNLNRALKNKTLVPFRPQASFLSLISTGNKYALASKSQWMIAGRIMWRWKNWIDHRFMQRFTQLPKMNAKQIGVGTHLPEGQAFNLDSRDGLSPKTKFYCAGCGSKVGKTVLQSVLSELQPIQRDDVIAGIEQADDAALVKVDGNRLLVHTVDHFRTFIDDPYLFGKICTNHALSDLFAMGAEPQTALAMTTLSHGNEKQLQQELRQVLSGAVDALNSAGCALVGGHTNEGDDLSLGMSINGLINPDKVLSKTGLQVGDHLILTKALGTGTLFAAHMRQFSKGPWIDNALKIMVQSNQKAAEIILQYQASACTDITGFGLIGHLLEMMGSENLSVQLALNQIPSLLGAKETLDSGIVSSLQPQNLKASYVIEQAQNFTDQWRYQLLFDPQTSGGLLAAVDEKNVLACLDALHQVGYHDAVSIGKVLASSDGDGPKIKLQ